MTLDGSALTFTPDDDALQHLAVSWQWLLLEPFVPVMFSVLGDMFFEPESGGIWWLNTGTAELTRVAETQDEFRQLLRTENADEWFMPGLIERLHAAGKIPSDGQCYTYLTLPVFKEGKYTVDNLNPVPARDHFGMTGHILAAIKSVPDGSKVRLVVTE